MLDLSDNHIQTVPLDTFHKMSQLTHLYLQVNKYIFYIGRRTWIFFWFKYSMVAINSTCSYRTTRYQHSKLERFIAKPILICASLTLALIASKKYLMILFDFQIWKDFFWMITELARYYQLFLKQIISTIFHISILDLIFYK